MSETQQSKGVTFSSKLEERVVFFFVVVGVVTLTLGIFAVADFLPEKPASQDVVVEKTDVALPVSTESLPVKVIIDSLEREVVVLNPDSSAIETLDEALLNGVVRHPDSADLINAGTIFILGHSSYLPNVMNKNFQAFNGTKNLECGDTIRLQSTDMEYVYSVDKVYEAKASDAEVPLQFSEPKLVLATCNSFGTKDDRFIVEASLVSKRKIAS